MLSPYRVLDLTDEKGLLCGKLLGDLGADVIKIERPGGDPARQIGPFYHDEVDPEKSLFWWAFNTGKRGVTLDIETADGQETFKRLIERADFVIESFPPGYLDGLGLGYLALEELNPGIILVSITPFGQTGPYRDYKAPDIVAWAMGGYMSISGDADRPPVRISHHSQSYLSAALQAAVGAMMALHHREKTGEGQHVDVSMQDSLVRVSNQMTTVMWDTLKGKLTRGGVRTGIRLTATWPCQDGFVYWAFPIGMRAHWNLAFIKWLDSEGVADDFMKGCDANSFEPVAITQETIDRLEAPTGKFFLAHTKAELYQGAAKHGLLVPPVSTTRDILDDAQLVAREYWVELEHPELNTTITYPGIWAKASEAPLRVSRRAPLIGEHNREVYEELDLSKEEVRRSGWASRDPAKLERRSSRQSVPPRPLEGIRVADFGWAGVGPVGAKTLSDYGAEVIKIEGRSRPDVMRAVGPHKDGIPGLDRSGSLNQWATGKLSVALNLALPNGVEVAKRLVAQSDIVIENFAGGVMKRMGLGYEELRKVKPDIILLSSCMMGQTGPNATLPGDGNFLTPLSGFQHIAGWPDGNSVRLHTYTDFIAAHFNVLAILAALDYRRRTGKGQYLDLAQYENCIHFMAPLILDCVVNGRVAERMGNRSVSAAPHNAYPCRGDDRWCAIAVFTDEEWQSFVKVIGNPTWTNDPKFATLSERKRNEHALDRLVGEWTTGHSAEEVMNMMQAAGVAAGLVETGEDLLEHDPQLKHRHLFQELDHPEVGKYRAPAQPFVLSKSPCELRRAPLLGEHSALILKEVLGMTDDEVADLVIEGVVE